MVSPSLFDVRIVHNLLKVVKVISNLKGKWELIIGFFEITFKKTSRYWKCFLVYYSCKGFYKTIKEAEYEYSRAINRILPSVATWTVA